MDTPLIVALLGFGAAVLGILAAILGRRREIVHRHVYEAETPPAKGTGCGGCIVGCVKIFLILAGLGVGAAMLQKELEKKRNQPAPAPAPYQPPPKAWQPLVDDHPRRIDELQQVMNACRAFIAITGRMPGSSVELEPYLQGLPSLDRVRNGEIIVMWKAALFVDGLDAMSRYLYLWDSRPTSRGLRLGAMLDGKLVRVD